MLFFGAAPIGLSLMPSMIMRMKFRLILFIASIGPQILLIVPYYANACFYNYSGWCNIGLFYTICVVLSTIAGILQGVLFFGMLFYLTNISLNEDKPIYYGAFFLMYQFILHISHNFQWMSSSLFGEIIIYTINYNLGNFYAIIIVADFFLSLLFFAIPEPKGESRL
jgi:hypothetical protein